MNEDKTPPTAEEGILEEIQKKGARIPKWNLTGVMNSLKSYRQEVLRKEGRELYESGIQHALDIVRETSKDSWSQAWDEIKDEGDRNFSALLQKMK